MSIGNRVQAAKLLTLVERRVISKKRPKRKRKKRRSRHR